MRELGKRFFTEEYLKNYGKSLSLEGVDLFLFNESVKNSLREQNENKTFDIFLSHSSNDTELIMNFHTLLEKEGLNVYVDWIEDSDTGRSMISKKLKKAMINSKKLLYVHTDNSTLSKWTPWEIGFFDSKKGENSIFVMPILNSKKSIAPYDGQEYLTQYIQLGVDKLDDLFK